MTTEPTVNDAYPPEKIARRVEELGEKKAHADALKLLVLGILAGAFISLGGLFYLVVITDSGLGFGTTRLLGGLCFSLGLILVIVAGAELFTGNNLIAMAWASGRISFKDVLRNWILVYLGNVIGCIGTVILVHLCNIDSFHNGAVGETAIAVAQGKANLSLIEAFARGILCNAFVCLAVWLAIGARSVSDKILAIIFPITAFVVLGLEHSIANWFFLPYGMLLDNENLVSMNGAIQNIITVSVGNILGGTLLVAGVYWIAYLRKAKQSGG